MKIYYTYLDATNESDVIIAIDGLAWDYQEQLPSHDMYDDPAERKSDLIAMLTRWRDCGTLETYFAETFDDAKYPASEILTRFPDAKELK
jgi:hypothetical protein